MMRNRAGWLALTALAIASLLMVFFVLPRINQDANPVADAVNAAGNAVKEAVTETQQAAKAPDAEADKKATPAPAAPVPQVDAAAISPSFDVLRVEPDGSAVIAGRAQPDSDLEITNGATVVARVKVGPSGDFATALDDPLPPGDHQLVLRSTGKDGTSTTSEETATVSVPADRNGKLLAMVTKPGKASRVMAMPAPNGTASAGADEQAASGTSPAANNDTATIAPASATGSHALQETSPAEATAGLPALPAGSSGLASSAPSMAAAPTAPLSANAAPTDSELRVTAVEIEGPKLFVAGMSKPGTSVRGEADGKLIGTAKGGPDGSFVIEGILDLPVGDHKIAVESLGANGQATVRVEVPFNRPAGEQVAAVADSSISTSMSGVDGGTLDNLRSGAARAYNLLQDLYADGKQPTAEEVAAARSATGIALKSLSEYRLPAGASPAAGSIAEAAAQDAAAALAALDNLPKDVAAVGSSIGDVGDMVARAVGPVIAQQIKGVDSAVGAPEAVAANGARTIQQAPLTQSQRNSVIIRRGDTLWQISRRVYGQGVRYTTIYLANEDQIANPDIIQPGQIFGVPEEYRPDSEELHRQRLQQRRS